MNNKLIDLKNRIQGPVYSVMTPFLKNEEIDFLSLENSLQRIYDGGGRIFYVMGYNSRFSELSWEEIRLLNSFVTQKVKAIDSNNIMIVADPLHCSTKISIEFARHAQEIGADLISIINREKFYSEEQIYRHYKMIADAVDIGILVHEMPFLNGYGGPVVNWPISLLDRVVDIPNVIAVKEDAKDDAFSKQVIEKIKDRAAIIISGGGKRQWLQFAEVGCQSWLNGIGVFDPRLASKFWEYYQAGNKEAYMRIINEIEVPFFEKGVKKYGWHLTIKAAMEALGVIHRYERMPLMELGAEEAMDVKRLIESLPVDEVVSQ
ncbi:dihydrodipicolinate synthase family protein [Marinoscillum sp. 108]|uniref:dihydrodipicolinate synthase family protein n=1 Tax=Marinoscillum sp. 108 TaxID=2653151 RepID=UPI0012F0A444|nr:dihydrodipicolinate synthase family protein [Marinoscillum sp. 108]VXD10675.1 Dihydrodipicolinate synthase/N-acetylneuraminate lyase [Marinoscillum sp. 108]